MNRWLKVAVLIMIGFLLGCIVMGLSIDYSIQVSKCPEPQLLIIPQPCDCDNPYVQETSYETHIH